MNIEKIKLYAKIYRFLLLIILGIGFVEKLLFGRAKLGVIGIFIGIPIFTVVYIFFYLKWRKKLEDNYEIFRAKFLLKTGEVHHKMYYIAQFIIIVIIYFFYKIVV